ncbi:MAG: TRAP transporter small permease [Pseudomonadota bacterium]
MATKTHAVVANTGGNPFLIAVNWLSTVAGWLSATMIVAGVAITCQMIFVRFVLNQSTIWQTEAVIYLIIGATLIGLPYVQRLRGHVNVDLFPMVLKGETRRRMAMFTLSLSILVIGVMFFYGVELWHFAWSRGWRSDTVWGVQLWIPYLAIPVGFGLFLLQMIADLVAVILRIDAPFGLEDN